MYDGIWGFYVKLIAFDLHTCGVYCAEGHARAHALHILMSLTPQHSQIPLPSFSSSGEESWRNREGERLADFGVDEMADFYDEEGKGDMDMTQRDDDDDENVPLAELLRSRR